MPDLTWEWLGRQPYRPTWERQKALREAILAGTGEPRLWLLEHDPVVTLGRRAAGDAVAVPRALLSQRGVELVAIDRGGQATYHGPGQLVGYVILPLPRFGLTVPRLVDHLEGAVIDFVARRGVVAGRRGGYPGVWVGRRKIAAIGLHLHRLVTIHGFALNLDPDLTPYSYIVPCGIRPEDGAVSSLRELVGEAPTPAQAAPEIAADLVARLTTAATP